MFAENSANYGVLLQGKDESRDWDLQELRRAQLQCPRATTRRARNLVGMGECGQVGGTDPALGHCTCDLVLPKLVVFVRLLQGFDGRMVDLAKPLKHRCGQRRVREGGVR